MSIKAIIAAACAAILLAAGVYYYAFYSPIVLKRAAQASLDSFSAAIATHDRAKISERLKTLLTDSAHIRLEVTYAKIFQQNNPAMVQEFDTPELFITFIDNILYSVQDYSFSAEIRSFELSADKKTASLSFHSDAWADGNSSFEGTSVHMHFLTDTSCTGHVAFNLKEVRLSDAVCVLQLASLPKSGEEKKLQDPAVMKELMR